jgi:acetyl-CoA acetyltransferase
MTDVRIAGVGMTPQGRLTQGPAELARVAALEALVDADVDPECLSLIVAANALGGLLSDQECVRGQSWLLDAGLGTAHVVNVDNGCAGGASALHLAQLAVRAGEGTVLVVGVEKMWTGDRTATLNGIENCLTAEQRPELRGTIGRRSGSVFMGFNSEWATHQLTDRGHTLDELAGTAVKARNHGALNPLAQHRSPITAAEVLASAMVEPPLTRLMCSSFTDGAAAVVLAPSARAGAPRVRASVVRSGDASSDYHSRLSELAKATWDAASVGPDEIDVLELHDATSAEELYALESLGFFDEGDAGEATLRGATTFGTSGTVVNTSGGLVARGHPIGATGICQAVEVAHQLRGTAGPRQVDARVGMTVNTGGIISGDVAAIGVHVLEKG